MCAKHAMLSADAAWFRMDRPTNHMVINAMLTFDEPLSLDQLRPLIRDRVVVPFPRFRQRVVASGPLGAVHWEDDPHFDLDLHLHRLALPAPGDLAALQELVGDLMGAALDAGKPLWDMYLVDGYGPGCALVVRMHHCIADGIALAQVMLTLADTASGDRPVIAPPAPPVRRPPLATLTAPVRAAAGLGRGAASTLLHESMETVLHPHHLLDVGREARDDAAALIELLTVPAEHETLLKGDHGVAQRVAWTPPMSLPEVKDIAHATRTTVNDVLLAALSGGLARYLAVRGEFGEDLHIMVPFNIRPADEPLPADLGNRFGLILLALPIRSRSPRVRLADVHRRMLAIKRSRQPAMSYAILDAMGRTPAAVEARMIDLFSAKSTAVVTNVPGPREPVQLAGVPVREVLVWAPCAGSVGMSVSIFSYRDMVTIGFMTHASLVPEPDALVDEVVAELDELGDLAGHASS
jgi:diacylglycerol O-acyltransferase / wax synthase